MRKRRRLFRWPNEHHAEHEFCRSIYQSNDCMTEAEHRLLFRDKIGKLPLPFSSPLYRMQLALQNLLYIVDPTTKATTHVAPTAFAELNVKEWQDLQAWLVNKPEVLGEPLLLVTSEYDRFDKSDNRLDLLLLAAAGRLVIVELKLDASGTRADQQAIRYAAFCSTMTMDDVIPMLAQTAGSTQEAATEAISAFLQTDDLPELNGEPRIVLAAGSFKDSELTATVLWLRKFGVDISCVELTPYRYPSDEAHILLVPRTIIPLAEARSYQIGVEKKERKQQQQAARDTTLFEFWKLVRKYYMALNPELPAPTSVWKGNWYQMTFGSKIAHYEWMVKKKRKVIDVAVHFVTDDRERNLALTDVLLKKCPDLGSGIEYPVESGPQGAKNSFVQFAIPYQHEFLNDEAAEEAARIMVLLIQRTIGVLRGM